VDALTLTTTQVHSNETTAVFSRLRMLRCGTFVCSRFKRQSSVACRKHRTTTIWVQLIWQESSTILP